VTTALDSSGFLDLVLTLRPDMSTLEGTNLSASLGTLLLVGWSEAASWVLGLPTFFTTTFSVFFGLVFVLDSDLMLVLLAFFTKVLPLLLSRDFDFFVVFSASGNPLPISDFVFDDLFLSPSKLLSSFSVLMLVFDWLSSDLLPVLSVD